MEKKSIAKASISSHGAFDTTKEGVYIKLGNGHICYDYENL